jgi:hypothetical protein
MMKEEEEEKREGEKKSRRAFYLCVLASDHCQPAVKLAVLRVGCKFY